MKVYGFLQFRGIEKSGIAGMMSVMDLMSFRDLYGFVTQEKAEEIRRLKATMGAREVSRADAEAELFGGAAATAPSETRSRDIDERSLVLGAAERAATAKDLSSRVYSQEELDRGVALNAALVLEDPSRLSRTLRDVKAASDAAGLGLKVVDWQQAAGLVGQFVTLLRGVLFFAVVIFFAIALVVINNAMVMATLQRVKEIGTMRAIGAQRRFVVVMLLVEIVTVGIAFGLAGAALGGVTVWAIRAFGRDPGGDGPPLLRLLGTLAPAAARDRQRRRVGRHRRRGGDPLRPLPRPHRDARHARRGDVHGGLTDAPHGPRTSPAGTSPATPGGTSSWAAPSPP